MPKITKLCVHLVKLCRENCWLHFFQDMVLLNVLLTHNGQYKCQNCCQICNFAEKYFCLTIRWSADTRDKRDDAKLVWRALVHVQGLVTAKRLIYLL